MKLNSGFRRERQTSIHMNGKMVFVSGNINSQCGNSNHGCVENLSEQMLSGGHGNFFVNEQYSAR